MHVIVLVTCPDEKVAGKLADILLNSRLAACVNILPGMTSKYWWKGKLESGKEVLIVIKTRQSLVKRIEQIIKDHHPYELPEVIALEIVDGSKPYLSWIESESSGKTE